MNGTLQLDGGDDDPKLRSITRRFWITTELTLPVFLISMLPILGVPVDRWLGPTAHPWLQLVLATPVVLWSGEPFFERGFRSLVTGHLNMFTLVYKALGMPIAAGALYPLSSQLLLNPMIAAAAMSLSAVSVVANALRLRSVKMGFSQPPRN